MRLAKLVAASARFSCYLLLVFLLISCAPQRPVIIPKRADGIYHIVRPGENLFRIGKAYDLSHEELARVNGLKDSSQIQVGQRIFIPGATRQIPVEVITPSDVTAPPPIATQPPDTDREKFLWPVVGTINSGFGPRGSSFHDGIDIAAAEGTPIRAIERGEVIYSDQLRGYGNIVIVRHPDGLVSVYAHNEINLVKQGQSVSRGDTVARVGSTGRVTGPHLHFEIRKNNTAQDPLRVLPQLCCQTASDTVRSKELEPLP
jgi:lipoprotein NlpD